MSYASGEAALKTIMEGVTGFSSSSVVRQDWRILNQGKSPAAILRPGPWTVADSTMTSKAYNWRCIIEVWVRYIDDAVPVSGLQTYQAAINALIQKYPTIAGLAGVTYAAVAGGGEMQERKLNNNSLWAVWEIYYDWQEEVSYTYLYS